MAGDGMLFANLNQARFFLQASVRSDRTAWIKPAHVGLDRRFHFRFVGGSFLPFLGVSLENRREQQPGVRVSGRPEDLFIGPCFDDPSQVHDGHPIAHVPDHTQIVADK